MHPILEPIPSDPDWLYPTMRPKRKMLLKERSFHCATIKHFFSNSHWICVNGNLYEWQTNYYQKVTPEELISKIQKYCLNYSSEYNNNGEAKH